MHDSRPPGSECGTCGFQPSSLSPSDAIVAIRSFPRRYRRPLQDAVADESVGEDLLRARPAGAWSALELTAHVRDALHQYEKRLQRVVYEDDAVLAEAELEVPPVTAHDQGVELVLASFLTTADEFARSASRVEGDDWLRTARLGEWQVSALDLLREGVHEGVHHLRDLERTLDAARSELR